MKIFEQLTKEEFNLLKSTGILESIYPEAPNSWEERLRLYPIKPTKLEQTDWSSVVSLAQKYIDYAERYKVENAEIENSIFKAVMQTIYGDVFYKYMDNIEKSRSHA